MLFQSWLQVSRSEVLAVERVHNLKLWTKYLMRREEVVEAAGFAQERFLFHGSAPADDYMIRRKQFAQSGGRGLRGKAIAFAKGAFFCGSFPRRSMSVFL